MTRSDLASHETSAPERLSVQCCIAGGGPAGMMLGLLLARAGVDVIVLEKHADFLRDFRGDTIHPSTLEVMHELGMLDDFLSRPHQKVDRLSAQIGDTMVRIADFSHLRTRCKFIAMVPQWDFLDFLADGARPYDTFKLLMQAEVTDLLWDGDRVTGVTAQTPEGRREIRADLVVGADGRHSLTRQKAKLEVINLGAPMDVLWMGISRQPSDPDQTFGRIEPGRMFVTINRGDYWQCAYVIPKGTFQTIERNGLEAFRADIARLAPHLGPRVGELASWDDVKLLTVAVDRVRQWYRPGFLCIADAAHAMSPIGGVGINLAIQDAVAAANILAGPLRSGSLETDHLRQVQRRREWPTRLTQGLQVFLQDRLISRVLASRASVSPPWPVRLAQAWPLLQRIPARLVGLGFRPEHVQAPAVPGTLR
jgi:2-polyprenyl-6-methoxyphenol hydroxylase-like FAD-dependent oxidoreductase